MTGGAKRSPSPWPFPPLPKKVRFLEDIQPSQIRLTVVFGPKADPKLTIRIRIGIHGTHKPTVKVDFARGKKGARERSISRSPAPSRMDSRDGGDLDRGRRGRRGMGERHAKRD